MRTMTLLLQSSQGPRQGCAAGTHGFCLGLHPLLSKLHFLFPEFSLRALTDDIIPLIPPPLSGSYQDWQATYARYAQFLKDLKHLSFDLVELKLNIDKSGMLIPLGAPDPSAEVRAMFPPAFDFQREGCRIAGSPIGTDSFMRTFVNEKIREAHKKIDSIKVLGLRCPRAAHRLLAAPPSS